MKGHDFTTRRFPRSTAEAWPHERAGCIEGPHRKPIPMWERIAGVLLAFAIGIALAFVITN